MLNQCNFIGRLGASPEVRHTTSGKAVATFRIAVQERKDGPTEWVSCQAWEKLADIVGEYLQRGSLVYISGRMSTRKWQASDGSDRYSTEIVVQTMKMLSPRNQDSGGGSSSYQEPPPGFMGDTGDEVPF